MHSLQYVAGLRHIIIICSIQYLFDMSSYLPDQLDIQIRPHIQLS